MADCELQSRVRRAHPASAASVGAHGVRPRAAARIMGRVLWRGRASGL